MKVDRSKLNPLYHQYDNPENRLTHALLHTVASSDWILPRFLKDVADIKVRVKGKMFEVSTQKVPFQQGDIDPEKIESVPDAWIIDDFTEVGLAIEIKAETHCVSIKQLNSHANRILRYKHPHLLVITPDLHKPSILTDFESSKEELKVQWQSWDTLYRWFKQLYLDANRREKDRFLITSMLEYLERRRKVLGFQGIFFRTGFDVTEAKEILNAEMETIQPEFNIVYPNLTRRRPAITTMFNDAVWDCFGSEKGFTSDIHFTFSINEKHHDISMTIPNSAGKVWSRLKAVFRSVESESELYRILQQLRSKVPYLYIELIQRHFEYRRHGTRDGYMEFDIDTLGSPFKTKKSKAKEFSVWKHALKEAIINKRNVNAQVMFKSRFYLKETKGIDTPDFITTAKKTAEEFRQLYDFLWDL